MSQRTIYPPHRRERPRVLALGDFAAVDFSNVLPLVEPSADVCRADSLDEFLGRAQNHPGGYDLALVAQTRPGEWPADAGDKLWRIAPLTGRAMILGSWCEGEERTGTPWPGCERVFWYRFAPWWLNNLQAWREGRQPTWTGGTPATPTIEPRGAVLVDAPDFASADAVADALRTVGFSANWTRLLSNHSDTQLAGGVWMGSQLEGAELDGLRNFAQQVTARGGKQVVALLDFPRWQSVAVARELGATAVLAKPWRLEKLTQLLSAAS